MKRYNSKFWFILLVLIAALIINPVPNSFAGMAYANPLSPKKSKAEASQLIAKISGHFKDREIMGAGIIIGLGADRLYIATADHIIRQGGEQIQNIQVELASMPGEVMGAMLLRHRDNKLDLAVLRVLGVTAYAIPVDDLPFNCLGDSNTLKKEAALFTACPWPRKPQGFNKIPEKLYQKSEVLLDFESNLITAGCSGGGLLNDRGELVGMIIGDSPPKGRALRIEKLLETLRDWGYPVRLERNLIADINGKWKVEKTADNVTHFFTFKVVGKKLFGTVFIPPTYSGSPQPHRGIIDGMIRDNTISFKTKHKYIRRYGQINHQTGQRSLDEWEEALTHYHGTISANEINFIVTYASGHAEFTAKKIIDLTQRILPDAYLEQTDDYALVYKLPGHTGGVRSLSFGPDKYRLATGGLELASGGASDGQIKFWDTATAKSSGGWTAFPKQDKGFAIIAYKSYKRNGATDFSAISVLPKDHKIKFQSYCFFKTHSSGSSSVKHIPGTLGPAAISSDGDLVATMEVLESKGTKIKLRNLNGKIRQTMDCKGVIDSIALSRDGSLLALAETTGQDDTKIKLVETTTAKLKREISFQSRVAALAFSSDGSMLAIGDAEGGEIKIWDVTAGRPRLNLQSGHENGISFLTFNHSGGLLASAEGSSSGIKLWSLPAGTLKQTLNNEVPVSAMAFSKDDRLLAAGNTTDGTIRVWARPIPNPQADNH